MTRNDSPVIIFDDRLVVSIVGVLFNDSSPKADSLICAFDLPDPPLARIGIENGKGKLLS